MRHRLQILVSALLALCLLTSLIPPALAGDTPTFGVDMARTRRINSSAALYQGYAMYSPKASDYPISPGLQSYSTPTEYTANDGTHVVLTYAWEGKDGYLYGLQESTNAIGGLWGGPVTFNTQTALQAAGVSGPTTVDGYTTIGVGQYLYAWPNQYVPGQTSAASMPGGVQYQINGNPGNTLYQVAMSPAITGPVTWTGYDASLNPVTWQAPATVVGSWDGGVISAPVRKPANVSVVYYPNYWTTQTDPSSGTANITSSPTYIPGGFDGIGTNGDGAVVFGVSGINDPWMVAMDPATGKVATFGGGPGQSQVLATGISSSPVWSGNHLYVADNAGDLYVFNPDGSLLKALYVGGTTADDISNIALGENFVYAMEDGLTRLYVYDRADNGPPLQQVGSWAPGNGDQMYSPSLVYSTVDNYSNIYLGSSSGALYSMAYQNTPAIITSDESGFYSTSQYFFGVEFAGTPLQPYGTILADCGADHLLVAWTNDAGQSGTGGVEYWAPGTYSVKAWFTQNVSSRTPVTYVLANSSVILVAETDPVDDTNQVMDAAGAGSSGWLTNPTGYYMWQGPNDPQGFPWYWYATITAPSQPGTYNVVVTATDLAGVTAQTTVQLTVENTIHSGSSTMVNGQYLQMISYGLPGGFDNGHDPRPSPYLTGNLYNAGAVETKLDDHIHCQEIIPDSDILGKAPNPMPGKARLDGIYWGEWRVQYENGYPHLYVVNGTTTPTITHPKGSFGPAPDYETVISYPTGPMFVENGTETGGSDMEAQITFKEDWAGFFPHGNNYYITTNPWNGKKTEDLINPITGYSVSSQTWVTALYEYDPPAPPKGPAPPPEYFPEAVQYNSTVPLSIIGTDIYIIPTAGGSEMYNWN
jgi:hypothetical protein